MPRKGFALKKYITLIIILLLPAAVLSSCYIAPDDINDGNDGLNKVNNLPFNTMVPTATVTPEDTQQVVVVQTQNIFGPAATPTDSAPVVTTPPVNPDVTPQINQWGVIATTNSGAISQTTPAMPTANANGVIVLVTPLPQGVTPTPGAVPQVTQNVQVPVDVPVVTSPPTKAPVTNTPEPASVQIGFNGQEVRNIQKRLKELGYYTGSVDGDFGTATDKAVKAFQKANGLTADGKIGPKTMEALNSSKAVRAGTTATPKTTAKRTATPKPTATPKKTATPKPTATPAVGTYTLLKKGSRGNSVTQLQQRLISLHYLTGSADGIYGTGTESAVKAFQKANGLTADGIAGSATQKKLYSSSAKAAATAKPTATPKPDSASEVLRLGSTGDNVKKMQKRLVELGYLTSGVDGEFGLKTYSAVYAFQQRNGLAADGVAGSATLTKLYSSSAVREKAGVTPAPVTPTPKPKTAFTAPKAAEVRFANWYTEIRSRAKAMPDVVIYEPISGIHYNLHMFSFGKHADAEPPTAEDTALMYQAIGNNSWTAKPVWVIFSDGRVYMASTHSHGHEVDHTSGNNLEGHVCIHFPRVMSEAEQTGPYAVSHQQAILLGWERTQSQIGR